MIATCQKCGFNYEAPTMTTVPSNCPRCFPASVTYTSTGGKAMTSPLEPRAWRGDGVEIDLKTGKPKVKAMTSPLKREEIQREIVQRTVITGQKFMKTKVLEDWSLAKEIMPLIDQYAQQVAIEARIDELKTLWPKFTDIQFDGTNGREDNPSALKKIRNRIAELEKERKQ